MGVVIPDSTFYDAVFLFLREDRTPSDSWKYDYI